MVQVGAVSAHEHLVQFYESSRALAAQVADFLRDTLDASNGIVVIVARPSHLDAIAHELRTTNDVDARIASGALYLVDAEQALAGFMDGTRVDGERFAATIGTLIASVTARSSRVRVYGEMVDLLWSAGKNDAVFELEARWGELLARHSFSLLCGYHLDGFDGRAADFEKLTCLHDTIHPARALRHLEKRARALQSEIERRTRAERMMTGLLELTGELALATSRAEIARLTIENASRVLGAVGAAAWTVTGDGELELLAASADRTDTARTLYPRIPLHSDTPVAASTRTGEAYFLDSLDEYARQFPASRARLDRLGIARHASYAVVPLTARETTGAICFSYDRESLFDESTRSFTLLVARHCALALMRVGLAEQERAQREAAERSAEAEKQARSDVELLYELISSLNRLDDLDGVYDYALRSVLRVSQSDRAAILLFDSDNVMRFRAHIGLSEAYRKAVEGHTPWKPDESSPAPISVDDVEADPAWTAYLDVFRAEGIRALAFVPIVHQRKLIGKFMLYRNDARAFAARDLQLTATIAVHVAQGAERKQQERELARAYREEREARFLADEAARAREEILSVVSHDLRNPLGSILMAASTLLNVDFGDRNHRVRTTADRIHRQAERMTRLIEDLVDFAGIQAGRLALERKHHDASEILATTTEIFSPIAQERGLRLHTELLPNLPRVQCDSDRAVQVLSNLVSNAVKVTPKGGAIAIGAEPKAPGDVVFYVRDTGPGIEPEELPNLFERYWRGKESSYKGAGLGLSIARGIVDAHGGRIWAESRVGVGSTFYFSLTSNS